MTSMRTWPLVLLVACSSPKTPRPPEAPRSCAPPDCGLIHKDGVDGFRVGAPLADLPADAAYVSRMIADAQPVEGFRLGAPPVVVLVLGGPGVDGLEGDAAAAEASRR